MSIEDTLYLVVLEWHCALQSPSSKLDVDVKQVLFQMEPIKGSKIVVFYQDKARLYLNL